MEYIQDGTAPSAVTAVSCPGPDQAHVPLQKSASAGGRIYILFTAAQDGCLSCVKHLVDQEGLDPLTKSMSCAYDALDFSRWGREKSEDPEI